ncbi:Phosphate carrier protein, mitochondrial [Aphelenchoides besseyi]|nr:Phosphate carrier protein, mitochondrial [Aphelenchoides besseyi]
MTSEETCDKKKPVIITPFGKNYNSSLSSYSGVIFILLIWCYLYFSAVGTLYDGISSFLWNSDPRIHVLSKVVSQVAVTSNDNENSVEFGSAKFFLFCSISGFLSCGLTHTAIVPLDLIKCRIQVNPTKYKGILSGFSKTLREDGLIGLSKGWAPTALGYSMQGMAKFGLYELFKILYADMLGEENAYLWRTSVYLIASASAEFFADILLAPMEATKVRIQTSSGAPPTLRGCAPLIYRSEGLRGFYKGLPPLWMRQIPYTMMKFACFERTVELLYAKIVPKPQIQCTKAEQLVVTFIAGYIAGVFCAVVSHPADTIVSKLNQDAGANAVDILKKLGLVGVWGGLVPRIVMIGTLTALQWFIYDGVKVALGIPRPPIPSH